MENDVKNMRFRSITNGVVSFQEMVNEIVKYVKSEPDFAYEIAVGTDSQTYTNTKFALAIVVHRLYAGGIFFCETLHHEGYHKSQLQQKLYDETQLSLEAASELVEQLYDLGFDITDPSNRTSLVIHVDIGEKGKTSKYISELTGLVESMGYSCEIKPNSYAASSIADRYSK